MHSFWDFDGQFTENHPSHKYSLEHQSSIYTKMYDASKYIINLNSDERNFKENGTSYRMIPSL